MRLADGGGPAGPAGVKDHAVDLIVGNHVQKFFHDGIAAARAGLFVVAREAQKRPPGEEIHRVFHMRRNLDRIIAAVNVFDHEHRAEAFEVVEDPQRVPGRQTAAVKDAVLFVRNDADLVVHLVFHFVVELLVEIHGNLRAAVIMAGDHDAEVILRRHRAGDRHAQPVDVVPELPGFITEPDRLPEAVGIHFLAGLRLQKADQAFELVALILNVVVADRVQIILGRRSDHVDAVGGHFQVAARGLIPLEAGIAHRGAAQHHVRHRHAAVRASFGNVSQVLAEAVEAQADARVAAQDLRIAVGFGFQKKAVHVAFGGAQAGVVFRGQRHNVHGAQNFIVLRGDHHIGHLLPVGLGLVGAPVNVFHERAHFPRRVRPLHCGGFSLLCLFHKIPFPT